MSPFNTHELDRVQIFIDGLNLFGTLKAIDKKIDYLELIQAMSADRFVRARYYTTLRPNSNDRLNSVLEFLSNNGYTVETKMCRESIDAYGNVRSKGSMTANIAVGMVEAANSDTDHIVLFSGDSDLVPAVLACKRIDCRVTVVSSERTHIISEELRRACDHFIDIESLPEYIITDPNITFRDAA